MNSEVLRDIRSAAFINVLRVAAVLVLTPGLASGQSTSLDPQSLIKVGNSVFFTGTTTSTGRELWRAEASGFGVELVRDIAAGPTSSDPYSLVEGVGTLYFGANKIFPTMELWKSDGQPGGTQRLLSSRSGYEWVYPATRLGDKLLFFDGASSSGFSDGLLESLQLTNGERVRLKSLVSGIGASGVSYRGMTRLGDAVYFPTGEGLWKTDGTAAGTTLVKGLTLNYPQSVSLPVALGDKILFTAVTGADMGVWSSDGTTSGTTRVVTMTPALYGSMTASGGAAFFMAYSPSDLWKTDGTSAGTLLVKSGVSPYSRVDVNGTLSFAQATSDRAGELWKSDGTPAGTVLVKSFPMGAYPSLNQLVAHKGLLYFAVNSSPNGVELWKSDLTEAGTTLVNDIAPGVGNSDPASFVSVGDYLFFSATDGVNGRGLWRTDGTSAGTVQVDGPIKVRIEDAQGVEGNNRTSLLAFTVRLNVVSTQDVTVQYSTSDATATSGNDYVSTTGSVTIPAGSTSKKFVVAVNGDTTSESDETLMVTLTNPAGATILGATATGTITNDDPAPVATTVPQYRLYHDGTKEHLYTTDLNEYTVLGANGWIQEGVAYKMLTAGVYNGVATVPLFRLYHPGILQHHWTTDSNEASVLSSTWSYEMTIGYVLPTQVSGTVPLYRMALASPALHLWTVDLNEYNTLATRGWVKEGVVGYVVP